MKSIALTLLAASLLLSGCATLGSFTSLDKDADGRISREEASRSDDLASTLDYGDSNQDGYLNSPEYDSARELILSLREPHHGAGGGGQSGGGHSGGGHQH